MSVFHDIQDIEDLDGPTFFRLAFRLPAYEGASRVDLEALAEAYEQPDPEAAELGSVEELRAALYPDREPQLEEEVQVLEPVESIATLDYLEKAGPAVPLLGELAPIFEVTRPAEDS